MSDPTTPYVEAPSSQLRFGIARRDITPPVGIYCRMWGAAAHDRATGVHRPLTATAVVLTPDGCEPSSERAQVIVAVDHCLLWAKEMNGLLERVQSKSGVDKERLIVAFSHTHAAGLMTLDRVSLPGGDLIPGYLESLADRIADAVSEALGSCVEATITYGAGRCSLAAERDFWDAEREQFVCGFNPTAVADDRVLVARVTNGAGQSLATIVNYACHPTTLAWDNTSISPDYPGALRELVEQTTDAPCVFLQGASGDLGPREGFVGDVAVADRNGRQLGYAVLEALEAMAPPDTRYEYRGPVVSGATIGVWSHARSDAAAAERSKRWSVTRFTIDLPYRAELPTAETIETERTRLQTEEASARAAGDLDKAKEYRALVERSTRMLARSADLPDGDAFPFPVLVAHLGDAVWVAIEAEPYNLFQTALRERFPDIPIVVMTLTNGSRPSYLPPQDKYGHGIYQETIAVLAPGCLESLIDAIAERIDALLPGQVAATEA